MAEAETPNEAAVKEEAIAAANETPGTDEKPTAAEEGVKACPKNRHGIVSGFCRIPSLTSQIRAATQP